jgi:hypothetical protein
MEISAMINELKNESVSVVRSLRAKENEANAIRDRLHVLETEIQTMSDRYDALKMSVDSLELLQSTGTPRPVAETPAPVATPIPLPVIKEQKKTRGPRAAKRVVKKDAKDKVIGEYSSINKAAKAFGWTHPSMQKYIECTSKEKQIRLRGFSLEYATD